MADYYTQFSFMMPCVSKEAALWLAEQLRSDARRPRACECAIEKETELWLYAEECADIDTILEAISNYQNKYNDPGPISFEWANTCSKPMLDAFGGGAAVIYNGHISFVNTGYWVVKEAAALKDRYPIIEEDC